MIPQEADQTYIEYGFPVISLGFASELYKDMMDFYSPQAVWHQRPVDLTSSTPAFFIRANSWQEFAKSLS